jgi:hypothetical protein
MLGGQLIVWHIVAAKAGGLNLVINKDESL